MTAPILKIPVDDSAFKRFMEAFGKYQENLKGQPEMWKDVNREAASFAALGAAIVTDINNQIEATQQLAEEEAKRQEAAEKAERRLQQLEQDKQDRRQKAIETMKKSYKTLVGLAADFAKWSIGAGLAGGVMTFGLEHVAEKIGNERREAQGAGISIGQRRAMNLTMQRYYDVNSVVGNVANMQADPSQWATFSQMGVNPRGKDPAELSLEVARRAAEMFTKDKGNLALAQAQGLTNIFTPEDLRRLADALKSGELGKSQKEYGKLKGTFQLSDRDAKTWQDFDKRINEASITLQKFFTDKISVMVQNGSLDKIINSFEKLAEAGIDAFADIFSDKGFQQAVSDFAEEIKNPEFQKSLKQFAQAIGETADILVKLLPKLKVIFLQGTPKEEFEFDKSVGNSIINSLGFGSGLGSLFTGNQDPNNTVPGKENASYTKYSNRVIGSTPPNFSGQKSFSIPTGDRSSAIKSSLSALGYGGEDIQAIMANLTAESGLNPFITGDKGTAYGIGQWHSPRQKDYLGLFGHTMQSVKDWKQAISEQTQFIDFELHHKKKKVLDELKRSANAYDKAYAFSRDYESPAGGAKEAARRARATLPATHFKHEIKLKSHTGQSIATTLHTASL